MAPSNEAMAIANGIAQMRHPPLPDDLKIVVAQTIDDHTAALRAEVEALRAERDKYADLVPVWEWVNKHGGEINNRGVSLRHPNSIYHGTGRKFDFDSMSAAAKWIRHEVEMGTDK